MKAKFLTEWRAVLTAAVLSAVVLSPFFIAVLYWKLSSHSLSEAEYATEKYDAWGRKFRLERKIEELERKADKFKKQQHGRRWI